MNSIKMNCYLSSLRQAVSLTTIRLKRPRTISDFNLDNIPTIFTKKQSSDTVTFPQFKCPQARYLREPQHREISSEQKISHNCRGGRQQLSCESWNVFEIKVPLPACRHSLPKPTTVVDNRLVYVLFFMNWLLYIYRRGFKIKETWGI